MVLFAAKCSVILLCSSPWSESLTLRIAFFPPLLWESDFDVCSISLSLLSFRKTIMLY